MHAKDKKMNITNENDDAIKKTGSESELKRKRLGELVTKSEDDEGKGAVNENKDEGDENKDAVDENEVEMTEDEGAVTRDENGMAGDKDGTTGDGNAVD